MFLTASVQLSDVSSDPAQPCVVLQSKQLRGAEGMDGCPHQGLQLQQQPGSVLPPWSIHSRKIHLVNKLMLVMNFVATSCYDYGHQFLAEFFISGLLGYERL